MKYCLAFLFLLALASTAPAEIQTATGEAKCSVQGKVIQEPGEVALKKTTIQLIGRAQEGRANYSAVTDAEGLFKIEDVKPGRYSVLLEHAGFVEIKRGGHGRGNWLLLEPGQEIKDLVLRMQAAAVVTGKILDIDGDPMPNIAVSASRYGSVSRRRASLPTGYGSTNDLGEYRIAGLEPGRYLISAAPPANLSQSAEPENKERPKEELIYATTYYPGTADKSQAVPVELHAGEEMPVNFGCVQTRAFRVRGGVAKLPPGNFAGVTLRSRGDAGAQTYSSTVGTDGNFEFRAVLPGSYTLMLYVVSFPDMQMVNSSQTAIEVSSSDVEGVRLDALPAGDGQVRGRIRMDKGQKIDWSQLMVFLSSGEEDDSGFTQQNRPTLAQVKNDGSFEIKNVPAGAYRVIVGSSTQGFRDYMTKSVNLDGKDISDSGFTVSGGAYALDVVFSAQGGTIEGTVLDSKDHAVPYATVVCVPSAERRNRPDLYQQDMTDQQGGFSLRGLNPGEYTVFAWEYLEDDYRDPEFVKANEARGQGVRLGEGDRKNISVKVIPSSDHEP